MQRLIESSFITAAKTTPIENKKTILSLTLKSRSDPMDPIFLVTRANQTNELYRLRDTKN